MGNEQVNTEMQNDFNDWLLPSLWFACSVHPVRNNVSFPWKREGKVLLILLILGTADCSLRIQRLGSNQFSSSYSEK